MKWNISLQGLNKYITKTHAAIVLIWISFTVAAFSYAISEKLVEFDLNNKLTGIEYQQLATVLSPYLNSNFSQAGNTVLHFSKPGCNCQQVSEQHIQEINTIASNNSFNIVNVELNNHPVIPSTPSIAIVDNSGSVIYYGPYGQGLACSQTSGYAQTILNNFIKGFSANLVIKKAKGCYCEI